jgi:hypothetical protein
MQYMRKTLILLLVVFGAESATGQQWAIKSLPFYLPMGNERAMGLPVVVEYVTKHRVGVQVAPFAVYWRRSIHYDSQYLPAGAEPYYRQSQYTNFYHIGIGGRKYLGRKPINRAWFLGHAMWWNTSRTWSKEPIRYLDNGHNRYYDLGSREHSSSINLFVGKNFTLGRRWFIETKLSLDRYAFQSASRTRVNNGEVLVSVDSEKYFFPFAYVLVGYRW